MARKVHMTGKGMKILISGVGGQGIVFLTNILAEAAMIAKIPVSVSEIHGLSQRGGTVTAGIGLGEHITGFIGKADVDLLIGLELLETQRCAAFLHKESSVIFCDYQLVPFSVNSGAFAYPPLKKFYDFLKDNCSEIVMVDELPDGISPVHYNIYMLGRATGLKRFPFTSQVIEQAIRNTVMEHQYERTLNVFKQAAAGECV